MNPDATVSRAAARGSVFRARLRLALVAAVILAGSLAHGATNFWTGAGANNYWTNALNWSGAYAATNVNQFTNGSPTVNFSVNTNSAGLVLSDAAGTVSVTNRQRTMTLTGGGGVSIQTGSLVLDLSSVTLGAAQTWAVASGASLTVSNVNNGGFLLTITNAGSAFARGVISGGGGLTKSGAGVLALASTSLSTYTGNTIVAGGTLSVTGTVNGGGTVTVATNATLDAERSNVTSNRAWTISGTVYSGSGFVQTLGNLTLSGGTLTGAVSGSSQYGSYTISSSNSVTATGNALIAAPGGLTLQGAGSLTCSVASASDTLTIAGPISNATGSAGITKTGSGVLTLGGTNAYAGATTISAGTLALGAGGALAAGSSVGIAAGATLDVSGLGALATYTIGANASLTASGTGTVVGASAATIIGGASGTVNLGSRPIVLTYNGSQPALYVSQGTLSLNTNAFTVNSAAPLATGTYTIVQQASGSVISNGALTVGGTAIPPSGVGSIQVSGSNVNLVIDITPAHLWISPVNGGTNPIAGTPFDVVVQSVTGTSTPANVTADTGVAVSLTNGTGTLGGTLTGTIPAGTNAVTISGVTYTKAETNVILAAARTSGDILPPGSSAPFTVNANAAVTLSLTSGNNQIGLASGALASPFVVTVTDVYTNPAPGAGVSWAIATVPGGATNQSLSATNTTTAANGQVSSALTLGNRIGAYTVTATSGALTGSPVTFTATATGNLAVASVNGGTNPIAGTPFAVVVQSRGAGGTPAYLSTNTDVLLSLNTGSGSLGGTLSGTIPAGTNAVTISGVTYNKAESGVVLRATRTSGDVLGTGTGTAFTVNAGAAATIVLTSGNNQTGNRWAPLASSFAVTVSDAYTNPVPAVGVTWAIALAPGGATSQWLSATNTTTATNGQASSALTLGEQVGTYTVTATSGTLSGSPVTFTAFASTSDYTAVTAVYEYQICFKCHSGYAFKGPPTAGLTPIYSAGTATFTTNSATVTGSGTAWTSGLIGMWIYRTNAPAAVYRIAAVASGTNLTLASAYAGATASGQAYAVSGDTDVAQEFSPNNRSGHPIVTGLTNYPNSLAPKNLTTTQMKAPWNTAAGVGRQTMLCSDCHDATSTNSVPAAAQGPHGSASQFLLRGPNANNWPNVTLANIGTAWCLNCHNNSNSVHSEGNHSGFQCYACHIVIPHGGKVSRLMAANNTLGLPARYAYNNDPNTVNVLIFRKAASSSYSENGYCRTTCSHHSSGNVTVNPESW